MEEDEKKTKAKEVEEVKEKKENKKSGKKIAIIAIVTIIVVIAAALGGYFAYDYYEKNKSVGTEWGDTYTTYLEEMKQTTGTDRFKNYGIYDTIENATIQFCQIQENTDPSMVIKYDLHGNQFIVIWDINKESNLPDKQIQIEKEDIQLLYNIEKQDYEWYYYQKYEEDHIYTEVIPTSDDVDSNGQKAHKTYHMKPEDMPKDGETTISKFEETFIVPEVEESKEVAINLNAETKDLKNMVEETVDGYKSEEQILTEEVKATVATKETELNNKKEEIRKAEEEAKKKAEEEAKKKAEEEAKKKAEEEAKKAAEGFKVGPYTLKYGTYKCTIDSQTYTFVLKTDGTYTYKGADLSTGNGNKNLTGTFSSVRKDIYGYGDMDYGIEFKHSNGDTDTFVVYKSNCFTSDWLQFDYKGN